MAEMPRLTGQQLCDICAKHWWKIGEDQGFNVLPIACEAAQAQRELLGNYAELPTQEQLERDLDVLIVFENGDVDIPLTAVRIIDYLRGKE